MERGLLKAMSIPCPLSTHARSSFWEYASRIHLHLHRLFPLSNCITMLGLHFTTRIASLSAASLALLGMGYFWHFFFFSDSCKLLLRAASLFIGFFFPFFLVYLFVYFSHSVITFKQKVPATMRMRSR